MSLINLTDIWLYVSNNRIKHLIVWLWLIMYALIKDNALMIVNTLNEDKILAHPLLKHSRLVICQNIYETCSVCCIIYFFCLHKSVTGIQFDMFLMANQYQNNWYENVWYMLISWNQENKRMCNPYLQSTRNNTLQ